MPQFNYKLFTKISHSEYFAKRKNNLAVLFFFKYNVEFVTISNGWIDIVDN